MDVMYVEWVYVIIKVDSVLNCIMIYCKYFIFHLYILNHNKYLTNI